MQRDDANAPGIVRGGRHASAAAPGGAGQASSGEQKASPLQVPTISIARGGSAIPGMGEKLGVNPVTGTGSMTTPIPTRPGCSNFDPQLLLSYDTRSGTGRFGWNLAIPSITRKTDKGQPQYDDASESVVYVRSGAEDLVPVLKPYESKHQAVVSTPGFTVQRYRPRHRALGESNHRRSFSRETVATNFGRRRR